MIDTSIVWIISGITIEFMAMPNLPGMWILYREVKSTIKDYWVDFKENNPDQ